MVTPKSLNLFFFLFKQPDTRCIKSSCNMKSDIKYGAPPGSVLGPLLFDIDLIELFLECDDDNITS